MAAVLKNLSRREREIMEILYRQGAASAAEVQRRMSGAPAYSSVRTFLRILEEKGAAKHTEAAGRYVYAPAVSREAAKKSALRSLVRTFFEGSAGKAAAALLGNPRARFSAGELDRLSKLVEEARRKEGES